MRTPELCNPFSPETPPLWDTDLESHRYRGGNGAPETPRGNSASDSVSVSSEADFLSPSEFSGWSVENQA